MVLAKQKLLIILLVVFGFCPPKTEATACKPLAFKLPLKATHIGSPIWFGIGDIIKFQCDNSDSSKPHYILKGAIKIECQKDGSWSSKIPRCFASACPVAAPTVPNAKLLTTILSGGTNKFGNRITYHCNVGFKLGSSSSVKICMKNGYWEGNVTCVGVVCQPPSINNGKVNYTSLGYGSIANYSCDDGYAVKGQPIRICDKSGHWSGTTPRCLRLCPQLTPPINGYIHSSFTDYLATRVVGARVTFVCNANYRIRGDRVRQCQADGRWSGQQPKCVINTCGSPGPIINGFMTSSLPNYNIGTVVDFICHTGYKLVGEVTRRTCMKDGHWTGTRNPTCKEVFCEEPGRILYGSHNNMHSDDQYAYKSQVTYSCTSQYYLLGNATIKCEADSSGLTYWSGPVPSCLTLSGFDEECVRLNGKFKVLNGKPTCSFPDGVSSTPLISSVTFTQHSLLKSFTKATPLSSARKSDKELDTLTIVTASAGSTLGALVILLSVMVFVRRFHRNRRFRNHSIRSRFYSDDDHVTLIATYRGDVHFNLPSYDEAMRQVQRDPPPFESVVQSNGVGPTNNNSPVLPATDGTSANQGGNNRRNSSAHAQNENIADQHINIVYNPINHNSSGGTSLLIQAANQRETETPNQQMAAETFVISSLSSEESLVESEPSSSREALNLSVSEDDQSVNESQPLIIANA